MQASLYLYCGLVYLNDEYLYCRFGNKSYPLRNFNRYLAYRPLLYRFVVMGDKPIAEVLAVAGGF